MKNAVQALFAFAWLATLSPGADNRTPPPMTIAAFRQECAARTLRGAVLLTGTVTLPQGTLIDNPSVFYLQDETGGISSNPHAAREIRLAERLSAVATCSVFEEVEVEAEVTEVWKHGPGKPVTPRSLTVGQAASGIASGSLVRVRGTVASVSVGETRDRLTLEQAGQTVGVYTRRPVTHPSVMEQMAPPGSEVEVDGILIETSKDTYQVRMRLNGDLHLIRSSRPWLLKHLAAVASVLGLFGAFVALWIFTMHRSLRLQTAQIRKLLAEAQAASELKSQFLANVSHEIRTPLHGILGLQSLVLEAPLSPEQREQLQVAYDSTRSLRALLDDLLDLSRIEAGRISLAPEAVSLSGLVRHCAAQFAARASEKGISLKVEVHPELPRMVSADTTRLRQILTNLVSNAVKFTAKGEVVVSAVPQWCNVEKASVRFCVRDTGIGIAPEKLRHIFESFRQADGSITRRYGGSGLGLSISSRLTELMGGTIVVKSEPHVGSEFAVELIFPVLEEAQGSPLADAASEQWPVALRILLAEDNPVNQMVALRLLQKDSHSVCVANTGREAVERYRTGAFDLVLMDVQMPDMDGLEATRLIRSLESELGRTSPIIALSAHTMAQEAERCRAVGMDDFLGKPFHHAELRAAIRRVMVHS